VNEKNTMADVLIKGRYRLLAPIGSGGLGQVFSGVDEQLQRQVAIKRLRETGNIQEKYQDGWNEARALASLQHPNIVTLFDFGIDEDGAYFVMEYIAGQTMEKLGSVALLTEKDFRNVARQCLAGLGAAHELGIVHRDIKPTNIMVQQGASGEVMAKILDFGLAKFQKAPEPQSTDHENNLLGSIYFMAPEQFSREPIDGRSDLYALGNVFYYALTGRMAHAADTIEQIIFSHLMHIPFSLQELRPDLSPGICLWVHQLMQRDPLERPQNVLQALQLLDPEESDFYANRREVSQNFQDKAANPRSSSGRVKWLFLGVGVFLLVGIGLWMVQGMQKKTVEKGKQAPMEKTPSVLVEEAVHPVITDSLPKREPETIHSSQDSLEILDPINSDSVMRAKGRETLVEGTPIRVGENKSGTILYLNFSENFRSTLTLVFFIADQPGEFTKENLTSFLNKKIRIKGVVGDYNGSAQIKVASIDQIKVLEP
jgi:serine/threonine protein kinase